jgi:hypothetical protein
MQEGEFMFFNGLEGLTAPNVSALVSCMHMAQLFWSNDKPWGIRFIYAPQFVEK